MQDNIIPGIGFNYTANSHNIMWTKTPCIKLGHFICTPLKSWHLYKLDMLGKEWVSKCRNTPLVEMGDMGLVARVYGTNSQCFLEVVTVMRVQSYIIAHLILCKMNWWEGRICYLLWGDTIQVVQLTGLSDILSQLRRTGYWEPIITSSDFWGSVSL